MNSSFIRLIGLASVAGIIACAKRPAPDCAPADSAECFAGEFYAWYAKPVKDGGAGASLDRALASRPSALSPTLLAALVADTAAQSADPNHEPGIDMDPFLGGQDPCERYVVGKAEVVGGRTRVPVYAICNGRRMDSASVVAEVARTDHGFEITNVFHGKSSDLVAMLEKVGRGRNDTYLVQGACPFECCYYGKWTFEKPTKLLRAPLGKDSAGFVPAGETVHADTGFVWLHPTGIAVITDSSKIYDSPGKLPLTTGDTLYLLDYEGEGYRRMKWRDTVVSMMDDFDPTGAHGARLVRPAKSEWWVHVARSPAGGWVQMVRGIEVKGNDRCG